MYGVFTAHVLPYATAMHMCEWALREDFLPLPVVSVGQEMKMAERNLIEVLTIPEQMLPNYYLLV